MENKEQILQVFSDRILGIRNYKADKIEFKTTDFTDNKILDEFLDEVHSGEADITPAGKVFIEKYFGFDQLAKHIAERNEFFLSKKSSVEDILSWLENLNPMESVAFIEQAKGNIETTFSLRSDLLPPDNI